MRVKIISKLYGSQIINTENYCPFNASKDSTLFKIVEHLFREWYKHNTQPGAPMGDYIKEAYYGGWEQEPLYSVSGAIRQGIEVVIEEIKESRKSVVTTKEIQRMDVECAFQ
jgi:hypothetical protein